MTGTFSFSFLFLILAAICFLLSAANAPIPRANLTALGLFFWVMALMISGAPR